MSIFLEKESNFVDDSVEVGPDLLAEVRYTFEFQASGEDPQQAFDLEITKLLSIQVLVVINSHGEFIPANSDHEIQAREYFWKHSKSCAEDSLFRRVLEGEFRESPL